jgi:hypothetical protein
MRRHTEPIVTPIDQLHYADKKPPEVSGGFLSQTPDRIFIVAVDQVVARLLVGYTIAVDNLIIRPIIRIT